LKINKNGSIIKIRGDDMFEIGDKVKIDFESKSINKIDDNTLADIKKWDKEHNGIHKITDICTSGLWTDHEKKRYELDSYYMFFSNEINKIDKEK
jgi:hypothetical protein